MECRGIECCCRCENRLEFKVDWILGDLLWICNATKPAKEICEHGTCDLWEHIPSSQDPVGKNERLISAIQGAEKGILTLQYTLEEWHDEEGRKTLQDFLLKLNLAVGRCTRALSDCVDESREFAAETGIKE